MKTKPAICTRCGWPAVKVAGEHRLVDGLCFYCRKGLWVGIKRKAKGGK